MTSELENLVLITLSYFEPMTFSKIILDFDSEEIKNFPDFDNVKLQEMLSSLEKKKLIKRVKIDKETGWIRVLPKRSWWKRLFPL
ncbi:MAG: hypothetical protein WC635_10905 [Bacteriovorax sp.]|jgi:transcription initiation factor IIE alpha subunit